MSEVVEVRWAGEGVMVVALNRPGSHNAMNGEMIQDLTAIFRGITPDDGARVVVLTGNGRSFCAGADLNGMRAAADFSLEENRAGGEAIFDLMLAVDECPRPVIGKINGAAIGGGVGLVSCCDIVVVVERATFGLSEVRLGIVPAVISPFVLAKIGASVARQLFLTGERFGAAYAKEIGLVHHVVADPAGLDTITNERIDQLLQAAPGAQATAKEIIRRVSHQPKAAMRGYTSNMIAQRRASAEGREGMSAFLEKRKPEWQEGRMTDDG